MASKGPPRILVIDDEIEICDLITTALTAEGLKVSTASSAWEALNILESEQFDLMVTDIRLPEDLSGIELVAYARALQPTIKSLFVSGYSAPVAEEPGQDDFVAKPFRTRELLGCIYELLQRPPPKNQRPTPKQSAERAKAVAKIARLKSIRGAAFAEPLILVVDDDEAVLEVAAMMIEELGFTALRARSGDEALHLLDQHQNVMLLLTDVVMPGMDGWELARLARERHPGLKVLYTSGFIKHREALPSQDYGPLLPKPWRAEQFHETLKQILVDG